MAIPLDADFEVEEVAVELGVFDLFLGEGKEVSAKHGVQEVTEEAVFAVKEFFWTAGTSAQGAAVRVKEFIIAFEFVEEGVVVKVVEGLDAAEKVLEVASGIFGLVPCYAVQRTPRDKWLVHLFLGRPNSHRYRCRCRKIYCIMENSSIGLTHRSRGRSAGRLAAPFS